MIVGIIIVGFFVGTLFGITALIVGQSVWMVLLIYSGLSALSVFTAAAVVALRI